MPSVTEVRTFLKCLDKDAKNAVSAEDLLRVLQPMVKDITLKDIRMFIQSITGDPNVLLKENDLQRFLEEMGL